MADYMDDLFHKIKSKKDGKEKKAEAPDKKPVEKTITPKQKQPSSTAKPVSDTTKKLMDEVKKAEQELDIPKPPSEPDSEAELKELVEGNKEPKPKPVNINRAEVQGEQTQAQRIAKENDESAKKAEEAKKKIEEIKKELPPQEKVLPKDLEAVPDEQKSQTEKKLAKSSKKLLEEYSNTKIYEVPGEPLLFYWTPVPRPVGSEKAIINTIKEAATRIVSITPYKIRNQEQRRNVYSQKILEILRDSPELQIPKTRYEFYADAVVREMVGYGLIDDLIKDDKLEEIMVIGPKLPVYVFHRDHEMMLTNIEFYSDNEIQDLINRIARQIGRRVDLSSPLLDARLPDGSRVNATVPPSSVQGSTLTIRKFRDDPYTIVDMINYGTLNAEAAAFLWLCVEGLDTRPANILIAGGTGSGKTTTLNVMASFVPETERIISIEDTAELNLPLKHWIRMEARPPGLEGTGELTLDVLTKNSLRMRPDRIIVGEIRHDEAFSLFTAFNTGHDGSLGTVHANSPDETIVRVTNPPMSVPEVMLSGLNFIIVQHRLHDKKSGTIRRVTEIAEVVNVLKGKAKTELIYTRDVKTLSLKKTKTQVKYLQLLANMTGKTIIEIEAELKRREEFLLKLAKQKIHKMSEIAPKLKQYLLKG